MQILTYSPILHLSEDEQFGDIASDKPILRLSLLTFWLGTYMLHLFSIRDKHFDLCKVINLQYILPTYQVNEEAKQRYIEYIQNKTDDEISVHIDALKYKNDEETGRENTTITKVSIYNAALLVFLPLAIPYATKLYNFNNYILLIIIYVMMFYASALILSFFIIKVRSTSSFSFRDIAHNENPLRKYAVELYLRYQSLKADCDNMVSYNANLQKNIYQFLICIFLLLITINISGFISGHNSVSVHIPIIISIFKKIYWLYSKL